MWGWPGVGPYQSQFDLSYFDSIGLVDSSIRCDYFQFQLLIQRFPAPDHYYWMTVAVQMSGVDRWNFGLGGVVTVGAARDGTFVNYD